MEIKEILKKYQESENQIQLTTFLDTEELSRIHLYGAIGSASSFVFSANYLENTKPMLAILNDKEEAAYFYNDIKNLLPTKKVFFFPSSYKRSAQYNNKDTSNILTRTEVFNNLNTKDKRIIIITYPEALIEKVVTKKHLEANTLRLKVGEKVDSEFIIDVLNEYGFERTDFVFEPGQFSVRGSLIDIFSFSNENPYRIDFFGNDVETIRSFNIESQLSVKKHQSISIIPNLQGPEEEEIREPFINYIPKSTVIWSKNIQYVTERIDLLHQTISEKSSTDESDKKVDIDLFTTGKYLLSQINNFSIIEFGNKAYFEFAKKITYNTAKQPTFNKNFKLLSYNLQENIYKEIQNFILSENEKQIERLQDIFDDINKKAEFNPLQTIIHEGFVDNDLKMCFYTDHQIFERYHKYKLRRSFKRKEALTISQISDLNPGDYVVHTDHGIGKFIGLMKIDVNGTMQEVIRLEYKDKDIILVNIHSLHRISKYRSKEGETPRINKLGTGAWQKLKDRTKKKIKDIAKDLIKLYAERREQKGYEFTPDSYMQQELESSFLYEDTPDQSKATIDFKKDMESNLPMDRLVCGDVGFGKTEIAIRAAFKAVTDSKQVAVLVPTTILALQHYKTFTERLKDFPCNVDYISRLRSTKSKKETLKKLADGKVDILIGTHRIVGKDVKFKDLGLLIVDEEQKFGVGIKEKLKQFKVNVDTLTLTATPIPRTLQFSLMGARDMSIINTPPPNRVPVLTELHTFNEDIIKEAILYEVERNGQVFFVNNRVQNILEIQALLGRILPEIKTVVAHGQMEGQKLEKIMLDFIRGDYDVLIATTIIESGLDIPNANTMIINNAQNFGLSDLHQLRGRVGRSNKKAFCYLLAPPLSSVSKESRRRLQAIEDFSELGSGFNISMQDLDIRGAGNILGSEQSGNIADIGFETYHKILNEAILELKEEEYKGELAVKKENKNMPIANSSDIYVVDCKVETDLELMFPDNYITNITERIKLYRELDNIKDEDNLIIFSDKLTDRFGKLPKQSIELFNVVRLRWIAIKLGMEKIIIKNNTLVAYFVANQESMFYNSDVYNNILTFIMQNPSKFIMQERKMKLTLKITNVKKITDAIDLFSSII